MCINTEIRLDYTYLTSCGHFCCKDKSNQARQRGVKRGVQLQDKRGEETTRDP